MIVSNMIYPKLSCKVNTHKSDEGPPPPPKNAPRMRGSVLTSRLPGAYVKDEHGDKPTPGPSASDDELDVYAAPVSTLPPGY